MTTPTIRQTINWEVFLATSVGIFFSILLGFFVLKLVIGALTLATSYEEKDALKKFKDVFTASIKGLIIAVGGFIVLNTVFTFLRIGQITNPLEKLATELRNFETCIRDYSRCGR
jgi:hypothetical protein